MVEPTNEAESGESSGGGASAGANACEEAIGWAMAHFGAEAHLSDYLSQEVSRAVKHRLTRLPEDDSERLVALEDWRERGRLADRAESRIRGGGDAWESLAPRWKRTLSTLLEEGPVGRGPGVRARLAVLSVFARDAAVREWPVDDEQASAAGLLYLDEMAPGSLGEAFGAIGVWQISGIVAGQGRRRAARARTKIPAPLVEVFEAGLSANADLDVAAATRIQEVYLRLSRQHVEFEVVAERLGLLSVVGAAGGRFEGRLATWVARAPADVRLVAEQFLALSDRATRLRVGRGFRRSLAAFWDVWLEHRTQNDGVEDE